MSKLPAPGALAAKLRRLSGGFRDLMGLDAWVVLAAPVVLAVLTPRVARSSEL